MSAKKLDILPFYPKIADDLHMLVFIMIFIGDSELGTTVFDCFTRCEQRICTSFVAALLDNKRQLDIIGQVWKPYFTQMIYMPIHHIITLQDLFTTIMLPQDHEAIKVPFALLAFFIESD